MAANHNEIEYSPQLAKRLQQAHTADSELLFHLVRDPDPTFLRALLKNPRLDEQHLLALLQRTDLPEDLLKAIYRHRETAASHQLKNALLKQPRLPQWLTQTLLPELYLFELMDLCLLPGIGQDLRVAAERAIITRLESVPLGNKITLARRGTTAIVGELLKEGEPRLMDACLGNPRLREIAILQFLRSHRAGPETISSIARHPRWKDRRNLRQAILKNPRTPDIWFTIFLPAMPKSELQALVISDRLTQRQKNHVKREFLKRKT